MMDRYSAPQGPLTGIRVIEFAAIGPAPFCAMLLSDMGADVVRIDRTLQDAFPDPVTNRGRAAVHLDLKSDAGRAAALDAIALADVLIEGYRPGAMERLGLGPDAALARNPRLIYGRMTGWGQTGPLADRAGHDINYIAITGALEEIGEAGGRPIPPLNLVGDFGGGALYLAFGIAAALVERERSGKGQVIDAAIVDGTASLLSMVSGTGSSGFPTGRGINGLGGGWPSYRTYRCKDGRYMAVGALEEQFWSALADALGLTDEEKKRRPADAQALIARMEAIFLTATQAEWSERLADIDGCVTPVLSLAEAPAHPHNRQRATYRTLDGIDHPQPAPRLSRTPGVIQGPAPRRGEGGAERLRAWGVTLP